MKCSCKQKATRSIRGTPLCEEHYIEAIEHGALIVSPGFDVALPKRLKAEALRLERIRETYRKKFRDGGYTLPEKLMQKVNKVIELKRVS